MGTHYYGDNLDILRRYLKHRPWTSFISIRLSTPPGSATPEGWLAAHNGIHPLYPDGPNGNGV